MKISLVNMPFSSLQIPSIALHQLSSVIDERFGNSAKTSVHYLNHDFGALVGLDTYAWISESLAGHTCGFGEWLFRSAAFPEHEDNTEIYFNRYAHHFGPEQVQRYQNDLAPIRQRLPLILDELIDTHGLADADVVGLTSMFFQNVPSFALARRLKERNSKSIVVMGGANCEGTMGIEIVNHVPWIDFVFSGHALLTFPEFLAHLEQGNHEDLHKINGIYSRNNSKSIDALSPQIKPHRPGAANPNDQLDGITWTVPERALDKPPSLDYDVYLDSYERLIGDHRREEIELLFETSRGCWWGEKAHCTFCGLNGATLNFREMSVSLARNTIQEMVDRYSNRVSRFASVDNIIPKPYVHELLPDLSVPKHVTLFYEVKADLPRDSLRIMAEARVTEVQPGIESIATETLKLMRKGTNAFNNLRFLADCAAEGVKPIWNLLVGFPGESVETYEMYRQNLPRLAHLPPPSGVFPVRFDRFSPYFNNSDSYDLELEPLDYNDLIYPFSAEVRTNMAYYFRDSKVSSAYQIDLANNLAHLRENISKWRKRWEEASSTPRLRLIEEGDFWVVEDTRLGHLVEHELEQEDIDLLRAAETPIPLLKAKEEHGDSVDILLQMGLLFEERGRIMSLVFEGLRYDLDSGMKGFDGARGRAESASLGLTF